MHTAVGIGRETGPKNWPKTLILRPPFSDFDCTTNPAVRFLASPLKAFKRFVTAVPARIRVRHTPPQAPVVPFFAWVKDGGFPEAFSLVAVPPPTFLSPAPCKQRPLPPSVPSLGTLASRKTHLVDGHLARDRHWLGSRQLSVQHAVEVVPRRPVHQGTEGACSFTTRRLPHHRHRHRHRHRPARNTCERSIAEGQG